MGSKMGPTWAKVRKIEARSFLRKDLCPAHHPKPVQCCFAHDLKRGRRDSDQC